MKAQAMECAVAKLKDDVDRRSSEYDVVGGGPLRAIARALHRIIGAPDYEAYLAHFRRAHPEQKLLSRDEFARQRLEHRYSRPGSRCC